ncbi:MULTISPECIES: exo-beta-N-acetylmuramidase NamZ family protein [unclassified Flavobacterium]|uniref:exo-beta-N-acetylmuramidase NamZ family protein n=1 Tax=unclassified Flavobacterium TaxID=196869 RepID=UPI003F926AA7
MLLLACSNTVTRQTEPSTNYKKDTTASSIYSNEHLLKSKANLTRSIKTGADNFESYIPLLKDKKIGVVTNQTGIVLVEESTMDRANKKKQIHLVDFLIDQQIKIQKIFAPEHGFRGTADAGEHIVDGKDSKTGLPIISLYGDNKKPKTAQLDGIDIMVFDLQDVGARFYTYISSLHYLMEACAENNIPLMILDRPNPNGGIIDGPILEKEFSSFVGMHPVPILHGMTIGEYAKMINGEKWLKNEIQCKLTVIPCSDYNRNMNYNLPQKPSPNLLNDKAINLYASLCLFEGTNVSVGRGTEKQFQIYGSPYLTNAEFIFMPRPNVGAQNPVYNGISCYGEDLSNTDKLKQLELKWLIKAYQNTTDKTNFFNPFFTKLAGTQKLQLQIEAGMTEAAIKLTWQKGITHFRTMSEKYLIY